MRQADLAGLWVCTASHECHLRDGVVRRTERPLRDERAVAFQLASHRVNLRRLQTLAKRQWWQNARKSLRQHALAAARRAYHDKVVAAGCRYLKGSLNLLLALYVCEVELKFALLRKELCPCVYDGRLHLLQSIQMPDDLIDVAHAIDMQVVHHRSFTHVCLWHEESLEA